jgi:multicomponent Na+:H+ antiporter subunit D
MGTLNMADIALKLRETEQTGLINSSLMLFFIAFGIKAALFPFFFWLPASYPTPPVAITAFFAATLTKVGVYVIIRFYSLFVVTDLASWQIIVLIIAGITMVSGVLMAASAYDIRRILSFHIISQIGYMIMGLGFATVIGLGGAIYFIVHNMLSKTATFLAGGLIYKFRGSYDLKQTGWIYKDKPLLAFLFIIPALSLAGIPPTPGFFGKLFLIYGGFQIGAWKITAVAIVVSIITLFSMIKIWNEAFWKKLPDESEARNKNRLPAASLWSTLAMVIIILAFGLSTGYLADYFFEAGRQLLDADLYINTVLKQATP